MIPLLLVAAAAAVILLFTRDPEGIYKQLSRPTLPFSRRGALPLASASFTAQSNAMETSNPVSCAGIVPCLFEPSPGPNTGPGIIAGGTASVPTFHLPKSHHDKECSWFSPIVFFCGKTLYALPVLLLLLVLVQISFGYPLGVSANNITFRKLQTVFELVINWATIFGRPLQPQTGQDQPSISDDYILIEHLTAEELSMLTCQPSGTSACSPILALGSDGKHVNGEDEEHSVMRLGKRLPLDDGLRDLECDAIRSVELDVLVCSPPLESSVNDRIIASLGIPFPEKSGKDGLCSTSSHLHTNNHIAPFVDNGQDDTCFTDTSKELHMDSGLPPISQIEEKQPGPLTCSPHSIVSPSLRRDDNTNDVGINSIPTLVTLGFAESVASDCEDCGGISTTSPSKDGSALHGTTSNEEEDDGWKTYLELQDSTSTLISNTSSHSHVPPISQTVPKSDHSTDRTTWASPPPGLAPRTSKTYGAFRHSTSTHRYHEMCYQGNTSMRTPRYKSYGGSSGSGLSDRSLLLHQDRTLDCSRRFSSSALSDTRNGSRQSVNDPLYPGDNLSWTHCCDNPKPSGWINGISPPEEETVIDSIWSPLPNRNNSFLQSQGPTPALQKDSNASATLPEASLFVEEEPTDNLRLPTSTCHKLPTSSAARSTVGVETPCYLDHLQCLPVTLQSTALSGDATLLGDPAIRPELTLDIKFPESVEDMYFDSETPAAPSLLLPSSFDIWSTPPPSAPTIFTSISSSSSHNSISSSQAIERPRYFSLAGKGASTLGAPVRAVPVLVAQGAGVTGSNLEGSAEVVIGDLREKIRGLAGVYQGLRDRVDFVNRAKLGQGAGGGLERFEKGKGERGRRWE